MLIVSFLEERFRELQGCMHVSVSRAILIASARKISFSNDDGAGGDTLMIRC